MGTERHSKESTIPAFLSVRCGMRDMGRGGILTSGMMMDSGLPATTSSPTWRNILTSSGINDIVDQERNL